MYYFVKTPIWLTWIYPKRIWKIKTQEKKLFLTFDDGPHPRITPTVLDLLRVYNAKATFFCIGNNIEKYPEVYTRILQEGHTVGNHTFNHLNGWRVSDEDYFLNISKAKKWIDSTFFRPPYGRLTRFQEKWLEQKPLNLKTVMWTVLSGDFDKGLNKEDCFRNVLLNACKGAIVVFHDSEKSEERMMYALEQVLIAFSAEGWNFEALSTS